MGRFLGELNTTDLGPQLWELDEDFGQVTDDELLLIALQGFRFDGISIPTFAWSITSTAPMTGSQKYSAVIHDAGYAGKCIIIVDLRTARVATGYDDERIFLRWTELPSSCFNHYTRARFPRSFWDGKFLGGMRDSYTYNKDTPATPAWKRRVMYRAVRVAGWVPWRRYARGKAQPDAHSQYDTA